MEPVIHPRVFVDIELGDLDIALHLGRDLLEGGSDHPARAAPLGPKIDHDRLARLDDVGFEACVGDFGRG